jgi:hypothetical protein
MRNMLQEVDMAYFKVGLLFRRENLLQDYRFPEDLQIRSRKTAIKNYNSNGTWLAELAHADASKMPRASPHPDETDQAMGRLRNEWKDQLKLRVIITHLEKTARHQADGNIRFGAQKHGGTAKCHTPLMAIYSKCWMRLDNNGIT